MRSAGTPAARQAALRELIGTCWRSRAYGDFLSHVLVAEGAVDVAAEPYLMPWDMAALIPVVTEAGGRITGFDGSPALAHGSAVTSNGVLHDDAGETADPAAVNVADSSCARIRSALLSLHREEAT